MLLFAVSRLHHAAAPASRAYMCGLLVKAHQPFSVAVSSLSQSANACSVRAATDARENA